MSYIIYAYSFFLIIAAVGILLAGESKKKPAMQKYSIIVIARNEEKVLPLLLTSLANIKYPQDLFEIILVDDDSNDKTYWLMQKMSQCIDNVRVIKITNKTLPGKKEGLQTALEKATKDIILLTDADCIVDPDLLINQNKFWDYNTSLVVGYAPETFDILKLKSLITMNTTCKEPNMFVNDILGDLNQYFANLRLLYPIKVFRRFISLAAAGIYVATIGLRIPFSCSGRHLAVKRKELIAAGGYKSLTSYTSGDDKQALRLIRSQGGIIRYNHYKSIYTLPIDKRFNDQQKRRFDKIKMSSYLHVFGTFVIIAFYLMMPAYFALTCDWSSLLTVYMVSLFIWVINLSKHKERFNLLDPVFVIIYPYYFIFYTAIGSFGRWKWKT